jgi:hypothetical protein
MAERKTRVPELDPVAAACFTTLPVVRHHEVNGLDKETEEFEGSKFEHEEMPNSGDRLFARADHDRQARIGSGWFQETVGNEAIGTKGPEEVVKTGCLAGVWRKNLKPIAPGVDFLSELADSKLQALCGDLDEEDLGHGFHHESDQRGGVQPLGRACMLCRAKRGCGLIKCPGKPA